MNTLDIIIVFLLMFGGINGLRQGLLKALANLVGWVLALFMAAKYANDLAPLMSALSQDAVVQKITAFAVIVLIIVMLTWLISALLNKVLTKLKLRPLNRLAGGFFGSVKSLFIVLIAMQGIEPWVHSANFWKHSKMVQSLMPYAPLATEVSKEVTQEAIQHFHEDEKRVGKPSTHSAEPSADRSGSAHSKENPFH